MSWLAGDWKVPRHWWRRAWSGGATQFTLRSGCETDVDWDSGANMTTVAHLLAGGLASRRLLQDRRDGRQLVQHMLRVCQCRRRARRHLRAASRPEAVHLDVGRAPPSRKLAPLRRLPLLGERHLRPRHVRPDPHRRRPSLRPRRAHPLLRHVVHQPGSRRRHGPRLPRQPPRRRPQPAHHPLLGPRRQRRLQHGPLRLHPRTSSPPPPTPPLPTATNTPSRQPSAPSPRSSSPPAPPRPPPPPP